MMHAQLETASPRQDNVILVLVSNTPIYSCKKVPLNATLAGLA